MNLKFILIEVFFLFQEFFLEIACFQENSKNENNLSIRMLVNIGPGRVDCLL